MSAPKPRIDVAAGILVDAHGHILIGERPAKSTHSPSFWEFPGGKLEPGETAYEALKRELAEEIAVTIADAALLTTHRHDYRERDVVCISISCDAGTARCVRWKVNNSRGRRPEICRRTTCCRAMSRSSNHCQPCWAKPRLTNKQFEGNIAGRLYAPVGAGTRFHKADSEAMLRAADFRVDTGCWIQ